MLSLVLGPAPSFGVGVLRLAGWLGMAGRLLGSLAAGGRPTSRVPQALSSSFPFLLSRDRLVIALAFSSPSLVTLSVVADVFDLFRRARRPQDFCGEWWHRIGIFRRPTKPIPDFLAGPFSHPVAHVIAVLLTALLFCHIAVRTVPASTCPFFTETIFKESVEKKHQGGGIQPQNGKSLSCINVVRGHLVVLSPFRLVKHTFPISPGHLPRATAI